MKNKYQVSIGFNDLHETWEVELNNNELDTLYNNMIDTGLKIESFAWSIHAIINTMKYATVKEGMFFTTPIDGTNIIIRVISKFDDGLQYYNGDKYYYITKKDFESGLLKGTIKFYA